MSTARVSGTRLAPRRVRARAVTTASGESERYLFYRGVAHLDALLQTRHADGEPRLAAPRELQWMRAPRMTIADSWLVDIRADGAVAFRENGPITIEQTAPSKELQRLPLFDSHDYGAEKREALRLSMKRALVTAGLYDDEPRHCSRAGMGATSRHPVSASSISYLTSG